MTYANIMFANCWDFLYLHSLLQQVKIANKNNQRTKEALLLLLNELLPEQGSIEWINEFLEISPVHYFIDSHPIYTYFVENKTRREPVEGLHLAGTKCC